MKAHLEKHGWVMTGLLFVFMLINFANKAVLGLSAEQIIKELHLSHTQFGQLGSSFFLLFSLSSILVGFIINKASAKWTLLVMAAIWSIAQLPMMLTVSLPLLVANRIVLGAGEGPAFPVALHAIYKWFPNEKRAMPSSVISIGGAFGTGIIAPLITYVILRYSWHAAVGLLGLAGLVWMVVWIFVGREGPLTTPVVDGQATTEATIPYRRLLLSRTFVGGVTISFAAYWLLTLAVVWLPSYLHTGFGYAPAAVGWIVTLPALMQIIGIPLLSTISERLRLRGVSSRISRGVLACLSVGLSGLLTVALPFASGPAAPILCATIAFSLGSAAFTMAPVLAAEITPTHQRGAVLGISTALSTSAGIVAPLVMGLVVDAGATAADGFRTGFMLVGICVVAAAIFGLLMIDPAADLRRFARHRQREQNTSAAAILAKG